MVSLKNSEKKLPDKNRGVFLIAEAGCNFEGDLNRAKEMIKMAARNGADAIKFQTFIPEKLVTRDAPKFWDIKGCPGDTQFDEFSHTPRLAFEEYIALKKISEKNNIFFFSTPSDESSVSMLEEVGVPFYKISSMDITHIPLLKCVAKTGKPVILSTGASTIAEIRDAVSVIESKGNNDITLLHCITNYPTKPGHVNINMMQEIKREFPEYAIGYSDHTKMPESTCVIGAAVALGACVIEKHYTFDKKRPGYDHEISMDYADLKEISWTIRVVRQSLGSYNKKPVQTELKSRKWARRSLVAEVFIKMGTQITPEMLSIKRPGTGIEPKYIDKVLGSFSTRDIPEDKVLQWEWITGEGIANKKKGTK